jgi:hypothetical protein
MEYNIVSRYPCFENKTEVVWNKILNKEDLEFFEEMAVKDSKRFIDELELYITYCEKNKDPY